MGAAIEGVVAAQPLLQPFALDRAADNTHDHTALPLGELRNCKEQSLLLRRPTQADGWQRRWVVALERQLRA
jgi:hypothetical protein